MNRKIVALLLVICVLGFAAIWLLRNRCPIDQTTYDAIALGMPESEAIARVPISPRVEAFTRRAQLLAEAGTTQFKDDDLVKGVEGGVFVYFDATTGRELRKMRAWQTDEYSLQVLFSPDGKVIGKQLYRHPRNESWWDALWRFLRS